MASQIRQAQRTADIGEVGGDGAGEFATVEIVEAVAHQVFQRGGQAGLTHAFTGRRLAGLQKALRIAGNAFEFTALGLDAARLAGSDGHAVAGVDDGVVQQA
jgi:hypothetical protein